MDGRRWHRSAHPATGRGLSGTSGHGSLPASGCAGHAGRWDSVFGMETSRDPKVIKRMLTTPATWAVIGLSANTERTAYSIGQYLRDRLGMSIVPVNLRGEDALGARGYRRLAKAPGSVQGVDCIVNSQRVYGEWPNSDPQAGISAAASGRDSECAVCVSGLVG